MKGPMKLRMSNMSSFFINTYTFLLQTYIKQQRFVTRRRQINLLLECKSLPLSQKQA